MAQSDPQLLLPLVAQGDEAAMRALVDQYGGLVWSLARRLRDRADAEDLVQEVFVDLWKHAGRFDPEIGSESTFIAMITRRRLIDRLRRMKRTSAEALRGDEDFAVTPPAPREDLDDDVARAREAFSVLSEEQRKVLHLALVGGLTHTQIAQATGLPLGTVKTHARRGLIRIRESLQAESTKSDKSEVQS